MAHTVTGAREAGEPAPRSAPARDRGWVAPPPVVHDIGADLAARRLAADVAWEAAVAAGLQVVPLGVNEVVAASVCWSPSTCQREEHVKLTGRGALVLGHLPELEDWATTQILGHVAET